MKRKIIQDVSTLLKIVQLPDAGRIFRGQCKSRGWPLLPSIARLPDDFTEGFDNWEIMQDSFISNFKRYSEPYLDSRNRSELEWLVLARNYGLPTRLLDFTTNPLKALFFAVEDSSFDKVDGVLFDVEMEGYFREEKSVIKKINKNDTGSISIFVPKYDNIRVLSQESIYALFPLPLAFIPIQPLDIPNAYPHDIRYVKKYVVPKENKEMLRKELVSLGISHMTIYPGLDGVVKTILKESDVLL